MKKFYYLILTFTLPLFIFAQTPKMVLYEGISSGSCPPCASANPGINALIEANLDKVVPIKYQVQVGPGDPMYFHNPSEANARSSFYNISGVPSSRLNGQSTPFNQNNINNQFTTDAVFEIDIDAEMNVSFDTVFVEVKVKALEDLNLTNLVTQIVVVEKEINFDTPPGTNGETRFTYIMRKFIPGISNNTLPNTLSEGEEVTFTGFWVHENIYEISELAVVSWVQKNDTREVYQAAIRDLDFTIETALAANLNNVNVVSPLLAEETVCKYELSPSFTLRNSGNENLTSIDVEYKINNSSTMVYNWTGDLSTFQSEVVTLENVPFFHNESGVNNLELTLKNPNGQSDVTLENNFIQEEFLTAPNTSSNIAYELSHDQYTDEITWELLNSEGVIMYSGGPYTGGAGVKNYTFELQDDDCYEFIIYDDYGDGQIQGATGVKLTDVDNNVVLLENFADYGFEGMFNFGVNAKNNPSLLPDSSEVFLSIRNQEILHSFNVFPNPTNSILNVELTTTNQQNVDVQLFDMMGRKIEEQFSVVNKASFNVSQLSEGVYFINVVQNGISVATSKVIVQ